MNRRFDLDWIRDIVVLSIIFFHSLIIFFTRESAVMYVRAGVDLSFCIYIEAIMGRFCMPILFILAGFSVRKSLEKRDIRYFIWNRFTKLFLPFVVCSLTLNPIVSYIYGITQGREGSFGHHMLLFVTSISKDLESRTTGYGPMHLWFILYLFVFSLLCSPLFAKLQASQWKERFERIANVLSKPYCLCLLVLPYPIIFLVDIMDEMNPLAYLYVFLFGYLLATSEKYQKALDRDRYGYLFLSVGTLMISLYGYFWYTGDGLLCLLFCSKAVRMFAPMAIIAWGHRLIPNKPSKLLTYLNGANYPIYLYHMCVLTETGYLVLKLQIPSVLQFILINVISYLISFGIYEVYRRANARICNRKI